MKVKRYIRLNVAVEFEAYYNYEDEEACFRDIKLSFIQQEITENELLEHLAADDYERILEGVKREEGIT